MPDLARPDVDTWLTRYRIAANQQRTWRDECMTLEQIYEQKYILDGIPSGIPIVIPSTGRAVVDEATDHSDFDPSWLKIHLPTYGMKTDAEVTASRLRSFLVGWLSYELEYDNDVSPFRDWIKNIYLTGKGVYKIVADHERWPSGDIPEDATVDQEREIDEMTTAEREFAGVPVVLRSIYPLALYEDPSIGEKRWAIEVYEYGASEILPLYEDWLPSQTTREELEVQEARLAVWDCYQIGKDDTGCPGIWHQVLINEVPVNADGIVADVEPILTPASGQPDATFLCYEPFPYVIKFSGLGRQSTGKYEEKARGILAAVQSLLKAEARRATQLDAVISQMAWPTIFVTGNRARFNVSFGPNVVNYVPPGTEVNPVTPQLPAGPIQAALATLQAGIERGTFGSVIRGDKPPNTTSAAQLAILSGQARLRFGAINIQHQAALASACAKMAYITKNVIAAPVTVWQTESTDEENPNKLQIKPSQIPDRLIVRFEIDQDPAETRDREIQLASFMYDKGAIDLEEFRERCGIRDTAAMRRRVIRDKVLMESPAVISALGEQFLLESGYDLESLTLEKAMRDMLIMRRQQEMQAQIMGGGGGANPNGSQPGAAPMGATPMGGAPPVPGINGPTPGMAEQAAQQQSKSHGVIYSAPEMNSEGGKTQLRSLV